MFTFNGILATQYGTVTVNPIIKKPQRSNRITHIEGTDISVRENLGLLPIIIETQLTLFENTNIDDVKEWLNAGGILQLSEFPGRAINVFCDDEIDFNRFSKGINRRVLDIEFLALDPHFYTFDEIPLNVTDPGNIVNHGNTIALPILEITGTGTVTVTLNGFVFTYNFDTPTVVIDSQRRDAYSGSTLKNRRMTGAFPRLNKGNNAISWTGNITLIRVSGRSRWL